MRARTIDWLIAVTVVVLLGTPALRAQTCDDSDPCTVNDMCGTDGECHGTFQVGQSCNDFNDCTTNDRCKTDPIAGNTCQGDPASVGTPCGGGCGTCQQLVPLPGVPLICSGDASNAGKPCDFGFAGCFDPHCTITQGVAFCNPMPKQCSTGSNCKGSCDPQTGECDADLSQCVPQCERCNAATNVCEPANLGATCEDSSACTGKVQSSCQILSGRGLCLAGTPSAASPTPTATQLGGASPTATQPGGAPTATATLGAVGTPTVPPTPGPCVGDCDGSGVVTINELIVGVNIALGSAPIGQCRSFDLNNNDMIEVNEVIAGVNALLNGCA